MKIKLYWPDFFTEYHKERSQGQVVADYMEEIGVHCEPDNVKGCDAVFCGSFFRYPHMRKELGKRSTIPTIHYSWDLYPWQIEDPVHSLGIERWAEYIEELKQARAILVPSQSTIPRHHQYLGTGIDIRVVKCSMRPFDIPMIHHSSINHVVDVMRHYPDRNCGLVKRVCDSLDIPCIETKASLPWDEYRLTILGAALLVSTYEEASTGGLSLLEGLWYGKPVLLCNSPRNGGVEYLGNRASYFQWDSEEDLGRAIRSLYAEPPSIDLIETRSWLESRYSERAFARRLGTVISDILGIPLW